VKDLEEKLFSKETSLDRISYLNGQEGCSRLVSLDRAAGETSLTSPEDMENM